MSGEDDLRAKLGSRLVFWATMALSFLGVVVLIGAAITEVRDKDGTFLRTAQLLLSALLPLFGTWVGTVLAFYYSKENFQTASQGALDLVRLVAQRLSATRAADKMMPFNQIITERVPAGKTLGDIAIAAVETRLNTIGANGLRISRLIIVDSADSCVAILHRSVYSEMLTLGLRDNPPVDPVKDPLGKLLSKPYPGRAGSTYEDFIRHTIAFIARDKTVADAKAAMESVPNCQDAIMTQTGNRSEPVLGWLSNVDVSRMSQA